MAIIRPENMDFSKQTFSMIIYGQPGIGKTTLALSAPKPILIDFDHGVGRVAARHRVPTITCETYESVREDLKSPDMAEFETIVLDTGGSFVTALKDWAKRNRLDGVFTKAGKENGQKIFGHVKTEFASFTEYVTKIMRKNVIYVFHSEEKNNDDGSTSLRLMCEGSSRNTVWNSFDFGAYLQIMNNKRMLCFTATDNYFTKHSHGIDGNLEVPDLGDKTPNDFLTQLFDKARKNIIAEMEIFAPQKSKYEETMAAAKALIDSITDAESAGKALVELPKLEHALTSLTEAKALLKKKTDKLGLKYDKASGGYVAREKA